MDVDGRVLREHRRVHARVPVAGHRDADARGDGLQRADGHRGRRSRRLRVTLSEPATVAVRLRRGRRVVKRLTRTLPQGRSVVRLKRLLRERNPGRYKLLVRATDTAGNASPAVTIRLRIRR